MRNGGRAHEGKDHYTESWCPGGKVGHVVLSRGARVRYLRVGNGPPPGPDAHGAHAARPLPARHPADHRHVHGLRSRLPGHGWSDIAPGASHEEPALRAAMVSVIEELDLSNLTLAGESMGA